MTLYQNYNKINFINDFLVAMTLMKVINNIKNNLDHMLTLLTFFMRDNVFKRMKPTLPIGMLM